MMGAPLGPNEPKPKKPRAPRKPKPEDTLAAMSEAMPGDTPAESSGEAAFPDSPADTAPAPTEEPAVDLSAELSAYLADLDVEPGRLDWVQGRRSELTELTKVYGEDIDAVLAWSRDAAVRVGTLLGDDDRLAALREPRQLRMLPTGCVGVP